MKLCKLTDTRIMADTTAVFLARCLNHVNNKIVFDISYSKKLKKYKFVFITNSKKKFTVYYSAKEILNPVTKFLSEMLKKSKGKEEKIIQNYYFDLNNKESINDDELPF